MNEPLCVDLFCGDGGWTDGFLDVGYRVIGYDLVRRPGYRGELVRQDVATISGERLRGKVHVIVASPPCTWFTHAAAVHRGPDPFAGMKLVRATLRVIRAAEPRF